jgi:O-methyltransferase
MPNILNIITISTSDFRAQTERLLLSLVSSRNEFHLTVYCDDAPAFADLANLGPCSLVELPEIRALGVKRAKFTAYRRAMEGGGFLYLDSDIIVLERLDELAACGNFAGCPDDLSGCPFIADKRHPWPGDPELENRIYINSGVFFAPSSTREFIERLHELSLSDEIWDRYIFPGGLYDNHFLCAQLNLQDQPVELLDASVYNWQGFYKGGQLQVERKGNALVNRETDKVLKLVHFAGIRNVDDFLCSLPASVSSLLYARSLGAAPAPEQAHRAYLASLSKSFADSLPDPFVQVVLEHLLRETSAIAAGGLRRNYQREVSYFRDPSAWLSLVYSRPNTTAEWNGLRCGGAYLEAEEYAFIRRWIERYGIRRVFEVGAGETSILFHRLGLEAYAIEPSPGLWLERAKQEGCQCSLTHFDLETRLFDQAELETVIQRLPSREVDLLFVDSPGGGSNRSLIPDQLLELIQVRYLLFHDAHRDAANLFRHAVERGLELCDYCPSYRGMVLFRNPGHARRPLPAPRREDVRFAAPGFEMEILSAPAAVAAGEEFAVRVRLTNRSDAPLSSHYAHPVLAAYHWHDAAGRCMVFDGKRTALPFDIPPGDTATFDVCVGAPEINEESDCQLQISLVQELVFWFHDHDPGLAKSAMVRIRPRTEPAMTPTDEPVDAFIAAAYRRLLKREPKEHELRRQRERFRAGGGRDEFLLELALRSEEFVRQFRVRQGIITEDMTGERVFAEIWGKCREYTITSMERAYAMYKAVEYIVRRQIPGDIVECGVWRGGSCMIAAYTLLHLGDTARKIYLYDTFAGMKEPGGEDIRFDGAEARPLWMASRDEQDRSRWWSCPREEVRRNLLSTGYPESRLVWVEGYVEETIPIQAPQQIALLRLDTDWYESTLHELRHLYPRLVSGGVLIIDDFGWWTGSRKAAEQYFEEQGIQVFLSRIDSSGARLAVKP